MRSDGELLEDALKKAGVKVDRKVFDGAPHEFFGTVAVVGDAKDARSWAGKRRREASKG